MKMKSSVDEKAVLATTDFAIQNTLHEGLYLTVLIQNTSPKNLYRQSGLLGC